MKSLNADVDAARRILLAGWAMTLAGMVGCATGPGGGPSAPRGGKGAPWTIQCLELSGPYRVQNAEQVAETLRRTPDIRPKDVFVRDESDGYARLYYGRYYRRTDPKTGKRPVPAAMRKDLDLLKQLVDSSGRPYFLRALPVREPTPDVGNPDWALSRARGVYTLQVAAFEPTDDFVEYKQAAAEFCALLREKGYEAYYRHSSAGSVVTVGVFGSDAVVTAADGRTYYSPQVLALQREELLKYNLVNGGIYKVRNADGVFIPMPSRLVRIPEDPGEAGR